jgi:hypothetical protein
MCAAWPDSGHVAAGRVTILGRMTRIFGLLTGPALAGVLLWSVPSLAQGADVMEDDDAAAQDDGANDDEEPADDDGGDDGGWDDEGTSGDSGPHFGLRLGYGIPMGDAINGAALSDSLAGQIPIWLDVGYQPSPSFMLGIYFSYGFGILASDVSDQCDQSNISCRISDIRLGLQAQYNFAPRKGTNPWLGVGVGYEWLSGKYDDAVTTYHGWELPMLQGGIDFGGDSGGSTIGPFVAFTMSTYSKYKVKQGSLADSGDIPETASHNWIFLGLRGVVN